MKVSIEILANKEEIESGRAQRVMHAVRTGMPLECEIEIVEDCTEEQVK